MNRSTAGTTNLSTAHVEYLAGQRLGPGFGEAFIRLHPEKVNSFGIE